MCLIDTNKFFEKHPCLLFMLYVDYGFKKSKMAARTTDAAASLSPDRTVFSCFLSCKSQCFCTYSSRLPVFKRAYSREFLLDVGRTTFLELNSAHAEELRDLGLLRRPTPSPTPTLLHLAHSGGATSGVRGSRRGVSVEVSELG